MKLISYAWEPCLGKCQNTYLADTPDEITADCFGDCGCGSMILVISTGDTYIKNTQGKWQKFGSDEVIA